MLDKTSEVHRRAAPFRACGIELVVKQLAIGYIDGRHQGGGTVADVPRGRPRPTPGVGVRLYWSERFAPVAEGLESQRRTVPVFSSTLIKERLG